MKILSRASLLATVDAFNAAAFGGRPWQHQAAALVAWVEGRLGAAGAYAGSFALTGTDWRREFRLFTGEPIRTRAARAHIIAEETLRLLTIVHGETGLDSPARRIGEGRLADRIFGRAGSRTAIDGLYCCGKCSVAFWRCLAAGRKSPIAPRGSIGPANSCRGNRIPFRRDAGI